MTEVEPQARSTTFDVFAPDDGRQGVLNSIRRYRAACREVYGTLLCAQAAGAQIEQQEDVLRVVPGKDAGGAVLAAVRGQVEAVAGQRGEGVVYTVRGGKGLAYDLRSYVLQHLLPNAMSFVWDSLRRDVVTVWTSKDPEFTKANRGWLALQGSRGVAAFNWRGIGFPKATARPILDGHTLTLKWDRSLGAVEFALPKLDGGRYHVWRALRDEQEGWKLGTLFLNERDGKIRVTLTHTRPGAGADVDPERVCLATFGTGESFLTITGGDGHDTISDAEAVAWLLQTLARRQELERRRAACGNPRRPWGHRKGWLATQDVLSRATLQRERGVADRNHAWTRRVVTRAVSWRCGVIRVSGMPEDLSGHPWKWSQFKDFLAYKAAERGVTVEHVDAP